MNQPVLFVYRKMKENDKVSRAKNPKYESMSLEELKANMEEAGRTQGTFPPADCQRGRV